MWTWREVAHKVHATAGVCAPCERWCRDAVLSGSDGICAHDVWDRTKNQHYGDGEGRGGGGGVRVTRRRSSGGGVSGGC